MRRASDEIHVVVERVVNGEGGVWKEMELLLSDPGPIEFGEEGGEGLRFCFGDCWVGRYEGDMDSGGHERGCQAEEGCQVPHAGAREESHVDGGFWASHFRHFQ